MKLLILGSDGFIGYHLTESILKDDRFSDWSITGIDTNKTRTNLLSVSPSSDFKFYKHNIMQDRDTVDKFIEESDIIMPLVAIATPKVYVERPMDVFELDFEENLRIIKLCHKLNKRIIFPSTSEVYGKSSAPFDEETSDLVYGPIKYSRWIYACSKQLLDRVIFALNQKSKFRFTLFRPFNWVGPHLDSLESSSEGSSRLITQLINDAMIKKEVTLVDGGHQKRCFTDVRDGVDALKEILLNEDKSNGKIYNVGNPWNEFSVKEIAEKVIRELRDKNYVKDKINLTVKSSAEFYGGGYQDVSSRVPNITSIGSDLGWIPKYNFDDSLTNILRKIV
jgi:nucleoside-diphosphate-sugar epimerase